MMEQQGAQTIDIRWPHACSGCLVAFVGFSLLMWAISQPIAGGVAVSVFALGIAVYAVRRKRSEAQAEVDRDKREAALPELRGQLANADYYRYIEGFAAKYGRCSECGFHLDELPDSVAPQGPKRGARWPYDFPVEDIIKLRDLLSRSGTELDCVDAALLVSTEADATASRIFHSRITRHAPRTAADYIGAGVLEFDEMTDQQRTRLRELLLDRGHTMSPAAIDRAIDEARTENELEAFATRFEDGSLTRTVPDVGALSGTEFEELLQRLFVAMGYSATLTPAGKDQGADLVIVKSGRKEVVQAKRYAATVGNAAVQEAVASIQYYEADGAVVVTTSSFTRDAAALARANSVRLIDGEELERLLREYL